MMLCPSAMKSRDVQVMLGTVIRSSSLGLSTCQTLMSSSEHVANNSEVPLEGADQGLSPIFVFTRFSDRTQTKGVRLDHELDCSAQVKTLC